MENMQFLVFSPLDTRIAYLPFNVEGNIQRGLTFCVVLPKQATALSCPRASTAACFRKVDIWLPGKGNSNSHGTRPVLQIISMIKWIRTSWLSIKKKLAKQQATSPSCPRAWTQRINARCAIGPAAQILSPKP